MNDMFISAFGIMSPLWFHETCNSASKLLVNENQGPNWLVTFFISDWLSLLSSQFLQRLELWRKEVSKTNTAYKHPDSPNHESRNVILLGIEAARLQPEAAPDGSIKEAPLALSLSLCLCLSSSEVNIFKTGGTPTMATQTTAIHQESQLAPPPALQ